MSGSKNSSSQSGSTSELPGNRGQPSAASSSARNTSNIPSGGLQQPSGSLSTPRGETNNPPVGLSQLSHGGSLSRSRKSNRGGMGADHRFTGSLGSTGSASLVVQRMNRWTSGVLPQGSQQNQNVEQKQDFNIHKEDFPPLPGSKGSQQQHAPSASSSSVSISLGNDKSGGQLNQDQQLQVVQSAPDQFGMLGLLNILRSGSADQALHVLGTDLLKLGLDMKSKDDLHKTFSSPWTDEPCKGDPEFSVPECYKAHEPPRLHARYFAKFSEELLFYIFYSMPRDEAQLYAANELHNRGWVYHKELRVWLISAPGVDPMEKTDTYERTTFRFWDPNTFTLGVKENFLLRYDQLEERPALPPQQQQRLPDEI